MRKCTPPEDSQAHGLSHKNLSHDERKSQATAYYDAHTRLTAAQRLRVRRASADGARQKTWTKLENDYRFGLALQIRTGL